MGIRKKIFIGFVIIGFILFLSGIISLFQLIDMEKSVSGMLSDNVKSIDISKQMIDTVEAQSWEIMSIVTREDTDKNARINFNDNNFRQLIYDARNNLTAEGETEVIDALENSYNMYARTINSLDSLFSIPEAYKRMDLFVDLYQPAYMQLSAAIQKLRAVNQNALSDNSHKLESSFHRMIMPPIIAIAAGLLLIILFNYFINLYFISPILKINRGIKLFLENKKTYNVTVDTQDEINDLNEDVKVLISQFKKDNQTSTPIIDFKNKS